MWRCRQNISFAEVDSCVRENLWNYPTLIIFLFWSYIQLKHYLDNPDNRECYTKAPAVFESLCSSSALQSHVIFVLYASMFGKPYASLHSEHAFWESALDTAIEDTHWDHIHLHPLRIFKCKYPRKRIQTQNTVV